MKWGWIEHFAVFKIQNNTFEGSNFHPFLPVLPPSALTFPCCCAGFSAPKTNSFKSVPTGKAVAEVWSLVLFFFFGWNPIPSTFEPLIYLEETWWWRHQTKQKQAQFVRNLAPENVHKQTQEWEEGWTKIRAAPEQRVPNRLRFERGVISYTFGFYFLQVFFISIEQKSDLTRNWTISVPSLGLLSWTAHVLWAKPRIFHLFISSL